LVHSFLLQAWFSRVCRAAIAERYVHEMVSVANYWSVVPGHMGRESVV